MSVTLGLKGMLGDPHLRRKGRTEIARFLVGLIVRFLFPNDRT
jgi:hypothetical protein